MIITEDYADSYGEGFRDGYISGSFDFEFECENEYNDENHFDVMYEGYIRGYQESCEVNTESTEPKVVVVKGLEGLFGTNTEMNFSLGQRYLLTVEEASTYYGLGVKTLYRLIHNNSEADFILEVGSHYKIKRELFEEFLKYSTNLD